MHFKRCMPRGVYYAKETIIVYISADKGTHNSTTDKEKTVKTR